MKDLEYDIVDDESRDMPWHTGLDNRKIHADLLAEKTLFIPAGPDTDETRVEYQTVSRRRGNTLATWARSHNRRVVIRVRTRDDMIGVYVWLRPAETTNV